MLPNPKDLNEEFLYYEAYFQSFIESPFLYCVQIFGPVQQILKFSSMEEVIARANNTTYGLAAGIITKDINKALTFAESVLAGSVW